MFHCLVRFIAALRGAFLGLYTCASSISPMRIGAFVCHMHRAEYSVWTLDSIAGAIPEFFLDGNIPHPFVSALSAHLLNELSAVGWDVSIVDILISSPDASLTHSATRAGGALCRPRMGASPAPAHMELVPDGSLRELRSSSPRAGTQFAGTETKPLTFAALGHYLHCNGQCAFEGLIYQLNFTHLVAQIYDYQPFGNQTRREF